MEVLVTYWAEKFSAFGHYVALQVDGIMDTGIDGWKLIQKRGRKTSTSLEDIL